MKPSASATRAAWDLAEKQERAAGVAERDFRAVLGESERPCGGNRHRPAQSAERRADAQPTSRPLHAPVAGIGTPPRVGRALAFIREKACEGITAADVAAVMPGSRRLAEMDFKKATGHAIQQETLHVRFERVELLLRRRA